jgi:hypothetical protein
MKLLLRFLLVWSAYSHRVTVRLPHDGGDDGGPVYEFLPYVDLTVAAKELVDVHRDRLVPVGQTFHDCHRLETSCLVAAVHAQLDARLNHIMSADSSNEAS